LRKSPCPSAMISSVVMGVLLVYVKCRRDTFRRNT